MRNGNNQPFVVLLIEDSEEDVFLFRRALSKTGRSTTLQHVRTAPEAQHYLEGEDEFADRAQYPLPRLIFSDLSLPLVSGLQFVEWLRAQPSLRTLPCIICSGSGNPADVQTAYASGVTSFIVKPTSFNEWVGRVELVLKFWMDIAQLPPVEE